MLPPPNSGAFGTGFGLLPFSVCSLCSYGNWDHESLECSHHLDDFGSASVVLVAAAAAAAVVGFASLVVVPVAAAAAVVGVAPVVVVDPLAASVVDIDLVPVVACVLDVAAECLLKRRK